MLSQLGVFNRSAAAAVAVLMFEPSGALAEGSSAGERAEVDGAAIDDEVESGATADVLIRLSHKELDVILQAFDGSPVAKRAERRHDARRHRWLGKKTVRQSLAAFADTQHGQFDRAILRSARRHQLDPFLLKGLLANESRLDPELTGKRRYEKVNGKRRIVSGGARGIAQFTAEGVDAVNEARQVRHLRGEPVSAFHQSDVWNTDKAIEASAELLARYIERFGRDGGVTAYNTGPYGGRLVEKLGFHRARRSGKLSKVGHTRLQGHRFLLNVLRHSNRFRRAAGIAPLPGPGKAHVAERSSRRGPNS